MTRDTKQLDRRCDISIEADLGWEVTSYENFCASFSLLSREELVAFDFRLGCALRLPSMAWNAHCSHLELWSEHVWGIFHPGWKFLARGSAVIFEREDGIACCRVVHEGTGI